MSPRPSSPSSATAPSAASACISRESSRGSAISIPSIAGRDLTDTSSASILTIDLAAVAANYRLLRSLVAPAECAAVMKADAYGLGLRRVAPVLWAEGCRRFFVAHLEEGLQLRAVLPDAEIAILNGLMLAAEAAYGNAGLLPVLNHLGEVARWQGYVRKLGRPLPAVLQVDTGMNRLGLEPKELTLLTDHPDRLEGIDLRLVMSHLACADDPEDSMSARQGVAFREALANLPRMPASLANSSGIFLGPSFHFDLTRPGCALYGINPTPAAANPMTLPVRLDARVLQVRDVAAGLAIGYGASRHTARPSRIATVSVGYADGYLRSLSNRGAVFADGHPLPLIGRVSMDVITVDATDAPEGSVVPGSLVEVIGPNRTPDDIAADAGTIGYEVLTGLGSRYRRLYVGAEEPAA